jgi:DnaK suppressor protein
MQGSTIRGQLQERREELQARIKRVRSDLRGETMPVDGGFADQATAHANDAVLEGIEVSAEAELRQIDHTLHRIDEGRYELCESCGDSIGHARLKALPYATVCMACASSGEPRLPLPVDRGQT